MLVGKHPDGKYEECGEVETVKHVLLYCKRYVEGSRIFFCELAELGVTTFSLVTTLYD
jgi:hypothetical protein